MTKSETSPLAAPALTALAAPVAPAVRVALAVLLAALGGCYSPREPVASFPTDHRLRHPIAVQEGQRSIVVFIGSHRGGLNPAQRADVLAFAHAWKREATGGVAIELPAGTPNERAAADALREIQSILHAAGVPPHAVYVRPYRPADPIRLATINIKYPKMVAEAGPCGLWPEDLGPSVSDVGYLHNRPYWNLGCATQRNLAAMVENPADLVQPRGETPAYTERRTTVLEKYRKGESTATVDPNEKKGVISDIGIGK